MKSSTIKPWIVILSVSGFFFFEFFQINMFNSLESELMREFDIDGTWFSFLASIYFYGTIVLLIPAGLILDRVSPKKLIIFALIFSLIGTMMFAFATSIYTAALGRFIVGITGGPFSLLSTIKVASRWFDEQKLAFVTGVIIAIGMLGGILSQAPFVMLISEIGWRNAVLVDVLMGAIILLIIIRNVQDYPESKKDFYKNHIKNNLEIGVFKGFLQVATKKQNWLCGLFASLLNLPIFLLGALWGNLYLIQAYGLSKVKASLITTMIYVGMLIGSPFFGRLSDYIDSRKKPMMLGNIVCLLSLLIVMQNNALPINILITLFFLIGFGSSAQIIAYPTVAESNPKHLTGSAESLAAFLIMSGGAVFQPLFGFLMDYNWNGIEQNGIPIYSEASFYFSLWLMPICMLIGAVALYFIKEVKIKDYQNRVMSQTS